MRHLAAYGQLLKINVLSSAIMIPYAILIGGTCTQLLIIQWIDGNRVGLKLKSFINKLPIFGEW